MIFGYRSITDFSCNKNGGRFQNGRHVLLLLLTHQVKTTLNLASGGYSYTSKNGECLATIYNMLATTRIALKEQTHNIRISVHRYAGSENMINCSGKG